ncbi:MAG TPA: SDR family oxidoreductase [Gemmatimonadaceae bacterium]|jgi:3-oxoacyl-[acyl-carrier protein] reductase
MSKPIAVITGASKGIGRATALRLAPTHDIVGVARSEAELDSLADEIGAIGGSCHTIALDITDGDAVAAALGDIDAQVLVNNAGIGIMKPFLEMTRDEWRSMVDLNFNALYDVTRAVLPAMVRRKSGHVVVIGSISGRSAFVGATCYAATKAAVTAFTESLMLELRDHGVKVSVVAPGGVDTSFSSSGGDQSWKLRAEDVAEAVADVIDTPPHVLVHRVEVRTLMSPPKK